MLYREFYSQYIDFEPMIIIIHDAAKMPDCADDYELIEYLKAKQLYINEPVEIETEVE